MFESATFRQFTQLMHSKNRAMSTFFQSKAVSQIWNGKKKFFINRNMWAELNLLTTILSSTKTFAWKIPIRHLIETDYDWTVQGDACLEGGAFSEEL